MNHQIARLTPISGLVGIFVLSGILVGGSLYALPEYREGVLGWRFAIGHGFALASILALLCDLIYASSWKRLRIDLNHEMEECERLTFQRRGVVSVQAMEDGISRRCDEFCSALDRRWIFLAAFAGLVSAIGYVSSCLEMAGISVAGGEAFEAARLTAFQRTLILPIVVVLAEFILVIGLILLVSLSTKKAARNHFGRVLDHFRQDWNNGILASQARPPTPASPRTLEVPARPSSEEQEDAQREEAQHDDHRVPSPIPRPGARNGSGRPGSLAGNGSSDLEPDDSLSLVRRRRRR